MAIYDTPRGVGGKIDTRTGTILSGSLAGTQAKGSPTISSTTLTPQRAITVPKTPMPTEGVGLNATIDANAKANADSFKTDLQQQYELQKASLDTSRSQITKRLGENEGQTTLQDKQYRTEVDPALKELNDINQQILADRESERTQIQELKKNAEGFWGTGLQDKIGEIQDKGIQRRAALAVTQLAAQGKYEIAKSIADRAVTAALERQKIKNDQLKFVYEENKDLFTKAEQRLFEANQDERDRKLDMEEFKMKADYEELLYSRRPKTGGGGTLEERQAGAAATLNSFLSSGQPLKNGNTPIDGNGYITPEAWNLLISQAPSEGLSRKTFIEQFGHYVFNDTSKKGTGISPAYKLTPAEQKLIKGEL
jgi:hypothetical protein